MPVRHGRHGGLLSLWFAAIVGCGDGARDDPPTGAPPGPPIAVAAAPEGSTPAEPTVAELRRQLGANHNAVIRKAGGRIRIVGLYHSGVTDIAPLAGLALTELDLRGLPVREISVLAGMPLELLYAEDTQIEDITPLAGAPLQVLWLNNTRVKDLSPLAGMRLKELNLVGTPVESIEPLKTSTVGTLWLQKTAVSDLSPLAGRPIESLDIQETPVRDLSVVATLRSLKRLNVAGSDVTDLTPLAALQLERLIFTPSRIQRGIDVVRKMRGLNELGTDFDNRMSPAEFWRRYDLGAFGEAPPANDRE